MDTVADGARVAEDRGDGNTEVDEVELSQGGMIIADAEGSRGMQQRLSRFEIRRPDLSLVEPPPPATATRGGEDEEYQAVIDEALQLVHSQYYRAVTRLNPAKYATFTLEELRDGPLGVDLARLARIAQGIEHTSREAILGAIDSMLQLLFWPVGAEFYTVPRSFWEQPLGRMLSLAKLQSLNPDDLMSISQAADLLGVSRPVIYRWMDERALDWVRDDASGRTFVIREDVEALRADLAAIEAEETKPVDDEYPFLAEPAVRALAMLAAPAGPVEWGDPEASAEEDREIMAALAPLRRAAEDVDERQDNERE
jgi:excisionase family DNA binding protein